MSSKEIQAQAIVYNLPSAVRRDAARYFVDTTGRRMSDEEIIELWQFSQTTGHDWVKSARMLADQLRQQDQPNAAQGSLF